MERTRLRLLGLLWMLSSSAAAQEEPEDGVEAESPTEAEDVAAAEASPGPAEATPASVPGSSRLEFDPRLVRGGTAAGSVYLFHRRPRPLPSLVSAVPGFRDRIVIPLFGTEIAPPRRPASAEEEEEAP